MARQQALRMTCSLCTGWLYCYWLLLLLPATIATIATTTASTTTTKVSPAVSVLLPSANGRGGGGGRDIFLLRRQKRYLRFAKGATLAVQTNIAKALISERPRGFNEITEYTLTYELPFELPRPAATAPKTTASRRLNCRAPRSYAATPRRLWCTARRWQPPRRRFMRRAVGADDERPQPRLLHALLALWARIHAYDDAASCLRRALCEAPHLLAPRGEILLHDLLRALLHSALPPASRRRSTAAALRRCARLHAAQCGGSVLQHVTESWQ